jgi:hypothetical protein
MNIDPKNWCRQSLSRITTGINFRKLDFDRRNILTNFYPSVLNKFLLKKEQPKVHLTSLDEILVFYGTTGP